jgi:protein-disulfide isomerase
MAKRKTPPPPGRTKGVRRRASTRVLVAGALLLVVTIVGVVVGLAATGSSNGGGTKTLAGGAAVQGLLNGIPQHGNVLGKSTAPVTIVEYIDLQCPYCQQFETQAAPTLIKKYVRTGKAKVMFRPIAFIGPDSQRGRDGAIAASQQNKMFNFVQLLYLNQGIENTGWLSDSTVSAAAATIPGVNVTALEEAVGSPATRKEATAFDQLAAKDHVVATPTILVGKSGGALRQVTLSSPTDAQSVASAVKRALG